MYSFSFENVLNGGGSVTGVIRGLNEGTGAASSVEVLTNSLGFGLGEFVGSPNKNVWTVSGGVITWFDFLGFGFHNTAPYVTDSTLFLSTYNFHNGMWNMAGLSNDPTNVITGNVGIDAEDVRIQFTPIDTPATIPLLGLALAALGYSRRKRDEHN